MPNERPRDFRAEGVSGEGAGNSMRGSCAPQIERDAFALIINPIELPLAVALVTTHHNAAVQLQVPFGARPGCLVPPVSGNQIRAPLIDDFAANFFTLKMPVF